MRARSLPALVAVMAWLGAGLGLGCDQAAVVISIQGDLAIPSELDGMCLSVADSADRVEAGEFNRFYRLGDEIPMLPQSLTIEPGAASAGVASVRGYLAGLEVARDRRGFEFDGISELGLDLLRCPGGDGGSPAVTGSAALPAGARVAVSYGRGGTMVLIIGASAATAYRADTDQSGLIGVTAALPPAPSAAPLAILAFDADADCDDDLLILAPDAPPILWRRTGRDFAELPTAFQAAGGDAEMVAAAADVDSDGDIDLVLGHGASLRLLRNDGAGRFQPDAAAIPIGAATDVTALAFGDIDGDGAVDLVIGQGETNAAPARVLLNDASGAGFFEFQVAVLPELPLRARALALGDANGDGALDLVLGALGSGLRLYINRGDGRLEDRSFVSLPDLNPLDPASIALGDWDGDCLPEIVVGLAGGGQPRSWRGSDTGAFVGDPVPGPGGGQVLFADVDDDGDRDLLIADATTLRWVRR